MGCGCAKRALIYDLQDQSGYELSDKKPERKAQRELSAPLDLTADMVTTTSCRLQWTVREWSCSTTG